MLNQPILAMSDEEAPPPRAFFDITPEEATEQNPSLPPPSVVVGAFGADPPASTPSPLSGAVASPNGAMVDASTGHFSGSVSLTTDGSLAFMPVPEKSSEGWGRFFLGMFAPWLIIVLMTVLAASFDGGYDDYEMYESNESIATVADENGTVSVQLSPPSDMHSVDFSRYTPEFEIWMSYSPNWGDFPDTNVYGFDRSIHRNPIVIGEYMPSTGELSFTSEELANQSIELDIWYYDEAAEQEFGGGDFFEIAFSCCLPILYVGSVIGAFVRGEKRLGWGLLTAIPMGMIIVPVTLFLFFMQL